VPLISTSYPIKLTKSVPINRHSKDLSDSTFGTTIVAKNQKDAENIIKKRKMGESIFWFEMSNPGKNDAKYPSKLLKEYIEGKLKDTTKVYHGLCWLGYVALKSKVVDVNEVLGDHGFIHSFIHYMEFSKDKTWKHISPNLKDILNHVIEVEEKTPGFYRGQE